jgi:hypothetical protein
MFVPLTYDVASSRDGGPSQVAPSPGRGLKPMTDPGKTTRKRSPDSVELIFDKYQPAR